MEIVFVDILVCEHICWQSLDVLYFMIYFNTILVGVFRECNVHLTDISVRTYFYMASWPLICYFVLNYNRDVFFFQQCYI